MEILDLLCKIAFTKYLNKDGHIVMIYPGVTGTTKGSMVKTLLNGEKIDIPFDASKTNGSIFFNIKGVEYELAVTGSNDSVITAFELLDSQKVYDKFTMIKK